VLTQCPVCDHHLITLFDQVDLGQRGIGAIYICRRCLALLNGTAYDALEKAPIVDLQRTRFYSVADDEPAAAHLDMIDRYGEILRVFFEHEMRPPEDLNFLDFGCGRGYAALAAAAHCRQAVACDYDLAAFNSVAKSLRSIGAYPGNITGIEELVAAPERFDIAFMWHVLEHLPYPSRFWCDNRCLLQPRATFIIQSPMFRPEYVIDAHFVFFTESSLHRWSQEIGAEVIGFRYDVPRGFIAAHVRMGGLD
jgi:2-polyprenyl-3-methyl-5-hydroxy-6-metoxy-1,4-benzoquinol methylase